jgi:Leucine-rich repeat (LRR) protein
MGAKLITAVRISKDTEVVIIANVCSPDLCCWLPPNLRNYTSFIPIRIQSRGSTLDLHPLVGLRNLNMLELPKLTIYNLAPLSKLRLRELDLSGTPIDDLTPLHGQKYLQVLRLRDTRVNSLAPLRGLTNLSVLDISQTSVTDLTTLVSLSNMFELQLSRLRFGYHPDRLCEFTIPFDGLCYF